MVGMGERQESLGVTPKEMQIDGGVEVKFYLILFNGRQEREGGRQVSLRGDFKGERRDCGENLISQRFVGSVARLLIREGMLEAGSHISLALSRGLLGGIRGQE